MNSIMIVDDEVGVRKSIKAKVSWDELGFHICGEASNGLEALQLLESGVIPDVLMTDIRMPKLDGIGLIRKCQELYPELKIIVLSGYSDYEYMKIAIQAGVKDYLLKPVGRRELVELLKKLSLQLQEERAEEAQQRIDQNQREQQFQAARESLLLRLAKEESSSLLAVRERILQLGLSKLLELGEQRIARFMTVEMRVPEGRLANNDQNTDLLRLAFGLLCREMASQQEGVLPFYDASSPAMMHFIIMEENIASHVKYNSVAMKRFVSAIRHNVSHYLKLECVIGLGEPVTDIRQFNDGFSSCLLSWSRSNLDEVNCMTSNQIDEIVKLFTPELERQLFVALENGDRSTFYSKFRKILPQHNEYNRFTFTFIATRLLLLLHSAASKYDDGTGNSTVFQRLWDCQRMIGNLQSPEAVATDLEEIGQLVMDAAKQAHTSSQGSIASSVQKYVDNNYTFELTLTGLAELFHLNETYLSGLFKQHSGMTFSDYVTKLRMNKAGELLRGTNLKLTDIAMLVGISSSSYFSTSFKKFYGISPKEYREKHKVIT